jgi:cytochrome c nitrite reductase small subunit
MAGRLWRPVKKRFFSVLTGFVLALLCFVGINAMMVPVSKSEYCGSKCHEMKTAYQTWELSRHGSNNMGIRVECIDCHLPSKDHYFRHLITKAYVGGKDTYKHYFGEDYDIEKLRKKVYDRIQSQRCMNCHDDLLAKPGSSAARKAHLESLANPDAAENRCVKCHENAGHERVNKLFSP